jgi:hypothetical protein
MGALQKTAFNPILELIQLIYQIHYERQYSSESRPEYSG